MDQSSHCPQCGTQLPQDAPEGLCKRCFSEQQLAVERSWDDITEAENLALTGEESAAVEFLANMAQESPGRYSLLTEHGRGGMGRVLAVYDKHLGRNIALKELLVQFEGGKKATPVRQARESLGRFLREAKITGRLDHPSITPVYELGRRGDGTVYYTMKLVRGRTFSQSIKDAKSLEERLKLLPHFIDLCQAIAYAHNRGIIHRDIKPSNIMIGDFGETVVLDWGLAKAAGKRAIGGEPVQDTVVAVTEAGEEELARTALGRTMGTPAYMSPEQARGDLDQVNELSDVYSLGAVLYELITGRTPFEGTTVHEALKKVANEAPPSIHSIERKAPRDLARVCYKAMAKEPQKRYQSAKNLAEAVQNWKPKKKVSKLRHTIDVLVLILVTVVPLAWFVLDRTTDRAVARELARLKAQGAILSADDLRASRPTPETVLQEAPWTISVPDFLIHLDKLYPPLVARDGPKSISNVYGAYYTARPKGALDYGILATMRSLVAAHQELIEQTSFIAAQPPAPIEDWKSAMDTSLPVWEWQMSDFLAVRQLFNLLEMQVELDRLDEKRDKAVQDFAEMLSLQNHVRDAPMLLSQLIGIAVSAQSLEGLQAFVRKEGLQHEWFEQIEPRLAESYRRDAFVLGMEMERLFGLEVFRMADKGVMHAVMEGVRIQPRVHHFAGMGATHGVLGEAVPLIYSPGDPLVEMAFPIAYGSRLFRFWRSTDLLAWFDACESLVIMAASPYYESENLRAQLEQGAAGLESILTPVTAVAVPSFAKACLSQRELEAHLDVARVGLALQMYKSDHGHYPDSLEPLAPEYLASVPVDAFTGAPLHYRLEADGFLVYSVGDNLVDDGGTKARPGDIVWDMRRGAPR